MTPDIAGWIRAQDSTGYPAGADALWRQLFQRQMALLPGRADADFLGALAELTQGSDGVPDFAAANAWLQPRTGFRIVGVDGLVPDEVFFAMLAERMFPVTVWLRRPEQADYIQEPDLFHDFFGHVPLLGHAVYADFLARYGRIGLSVMGQGALAPLARLYWYTVEFGLIRGRSGPRIYGAGIVSSPAETRFALEDMSPNHIEFDLDRVLRTRYRIDDFQESYFVIPDHAALFAALGGDVEARVIAAAAQVAYPLGRLLPGDRVLRRGTGDRVKPHAA